MVHEGCQPGEVHPFRLSLAGRSLWVWYWQDAFIDLAKRIGATRLLVKAMDCGSAWGQWTPALKAKIEAAGLAAIPWSYNDGSAGEAAICWANPGGLVIVDPEERFEAKNGATQQAWATTMLAAKEKSGVQIACACWYDPKWHPGYDFANLGRVVDLWIPMVDFQDAGLSPATALDTWGRSGVQAGKPTVPWVSAEKITPAQLAEAVKLAEQRYGGVTIWAAHCLTDAHAAALAA